MKYLTHANLIFWFSLLNVIFGSGSAKSQDFIVCADSVGEIEDAVVQASLPISFYSRIIVRLEQGTYNLSSSSVLRLDSQSPIKLYRTFQLLGGYTNNCVSRTVNATNTILTNSAARRLKWNFLRDVLIQGIHFSSFDNPIDIENFDIDDTEQTLEISNTRFTGGSGQLDFSVESGSDVSRIRFKNNQIFGRATDTNCVARFFGDNSSGTIVQLTASNNTMAGNGTTGNDLICFGYIDIPQFYNNIFYTNGGDDLLGNGTNGSVTASNNIWQSTSGFTFLSNVNNLTSNPLFVDYPSGDLRLQGASPASNSGTSGVPNGLGSVDVDGEPRVVGIAVDRGAHESGNSGLFALTVTNTNNSGTGSLREAITLANDTPGLNAIFFNIAGSCPRSINVSSSLPEITESLVVDGGTQPGSIANSYDIGFNGERCILLRGSSADAGFTVPSSAPSSTQLVVKDMAFGGFGFSVLLLGGNDHIIRGSQFGVELGAASNAGNVGVFVADADDVLIGGTGSNERNIFARQTSGGSLIGGGVVIGTNAKRTEVINNYFGTEPNGVLPADNSYGIATDGDDGIFNANLIANSDEAAVWLRPNARNNLVSNSRLGLPVICIGNCPISSANDIGILIDGAANRSVNNEIAFSTQGVVVTNDDNSVYRNLVYGGSILAAPIDIAGSGFTANDNDNVSLPPAGNRGINYPVLQSVISSGNNQLTVQGSLESKNGAYRINLYANDRRLSLIIGQGYRCEGKTLLTTFAVNINNATAGANGSVNFSRVISANSASGSWLTAQAVREDVIDGSVRFGDSSEFGTCLQAPLFGDGFED